MTDLATLRRLSARSSQVLPCAVAAAFTRLDPDVVKVVKEGLAEDPVDAVLAGRKPITNAGIARAVNSLLPEGEEISWQSIRGHRLKVCSCYSLHGKKR